MNPAPRFADYRAHIGALVTAALAAADPASVVRRHWPVLNLHDAARVFVVGGGKAGAAMGLAAEALLGDRLAGGVMAVPPSSFSNFDLAASNIQFIAAGHPRPDVGSITAGQQLKQLLANTAEDDLVLALVSGGASALLELPAEGVSLRALQSLTDSLLRSGAPIEELNCVRKHLSQIKGGGLVHLAAPARVAAFILSDVVGDPLDVIASGLTVADPTTVNDALEVLRKRNIESVLASHLRETPKPSGKHEWRVGNYLVGSNALARQAVAQAAGRLGFAASLPPLAMEGEARAFGQILAGRALAWAGEPKVEVFGGESTVTVRGNGVGGRNQELTLAAAIVMEGSGRKVVVASFGTDGVDGSSPAAGAIATPRSARQGRSLGFDPLAHLQNNDSHTFFAAIDHCITTAPTGTNVNDVALWLAYEE